MDRRFNAHRTHLLADGLILAYFMACSTALGQAIRYEASNLSDTTPGEDLWRYTYTVTGFTFQTNQGFSIFFDHGLYADLENPPPVVNADWSVITVQPDILLRQPGFYDGQALRSDPSVTDRFTTSFVWLGEGEPGSQPFVLYNSDFSDRFSGITVPEPDVVWLMALSFASFALAKRQMRRARHGQRS
jgi:hypothetical protein